MHPTVETIILDLGPVSRRHIGKIRLAVASVDPGPRARLEVRVAERRAHVVYVGTVSAYSVGSLARILVAECGLAIRGVL